MSVELFEDLKKYVLKSSDPENGIDRILDFQCELLFQDYLSTHAPYLMEKINTYNNKQKINNEIFTNEIEKLAIAFENHNLKLINLKGISLINEIYPNDNYAYKKRKIRDLDILIAYDELNPALDLLGEMGYYVASTKEIVSSKLVDKYLYDVEQRGIHFPEFAVINSKYNIIIKMDCHISVLHMVENKKNKMLEIINRSEIQLLNNTRIRVLEIHDRLLHLISHFTKENFRCDVRWFITGERQLRRDFRIMISLLHDIALIINKNKDKIKFNILVERAKNLGCHDEVNLVLLFLNKIYPSLNIDFQIDVDYSTPFLVQKYIGMFYPLQLLKAEGIDLLESKLSEKAQIIMISSMLENGIKLNQSNFLTVDESNGYIDRLIITQNSKGAIGGIKLSLSEEALLIELKGENYFAANEFYFTIGNIYKSDVLSAYVNKFYIDIAGASKSCYKDIEFHNGFVDLILKESVFINRSDNTIAVTIGRKILGIKDAQESLSINIGIPSLFTKNNRNLGLYNINDIGKRGLGNTFYFSPNLLQPFYLK